MYARVMDDGTRQTDYLADIVGEITQLPLRWAIVSALLMAMAFTMFGAAVVVVVLMVKTIRAATSILAAHPAPVPAFEGSTPT